MFGNVTRGSDVFDDSPQARQVLRSACRIDDDYVVVARRHARQVEYAPSSQCARGIALVTRKIAEEAAAGDYDDLVPRRRWRRSKCAGAVQGTHVPRRKQRRRYPCAGQDPPALISRRGFFSAFTETEHRLPGRLFGNVTGTGRSTAPVAIRANRMCGVGAAVLLAPVLVGCGTAEREKVGSPKANSPDTRTAGLGAHAHWQELT